MSHQTSLGAMQKQMADFLQRRSDVGLDRPGMRVYRNNVTTSLNRALESQFPAVKNLVGEQFFGALAGDYLAAEFPVDPALTLLGESFPAFINEHPACARLPWLADVAKLEYCRRQVLHAADDAAMDPQQLGDIPSEQLGDLRFRFRDSVRLLDSRWPVEAIRREALADEPARVALDQQASHYYLVARKNLAVITEELPESRWDFLDRLARGCLLGDAWEDLQQRFKLSDDALPALLGQLFADGVFSGFTLPEEDY